MTPMNSHSRNYFDNYYLLGVVYLVRHEHKVVATKKIAEFPKGVESAHPSYALHTGLHLLATAGVVSSLLSPDIKMHILLIVLHTFLMELVRRIRVDIKTSYPW